MRMTGMRCAGSRLVRAAVAGGLLTATGACGAGLPTYASARATAQAVELRTLLSALDELPEGLSARVRSPWRPPFRPRGHDCRAVFDAVSGRPPREGLAGTTAATFEGAHVGELAGVGLAAYEGSEASGPFEELREAMDGCAAVERDTPAEADSLAAADLPMPPVGDESAARRLVGRVGGYPYEMQFVVLRAGHALVAVVHAGLTPPDARLTRALADVLAREVGTLEP
ncbi:hypothetical protein GCM10009530_01510 [Microbispora corallina]|uniref:Sensor domain-containing protein n=2 Tax=Microbispora corallina TaxID=83302 RepID=A0ABQ4FS24_9ACTN|nr:hypothetical protein Mco01_06210 [Microbispora corallina]